MDDENRKISDRLSVIDNLKSFIDDDVLYGRIYGDLHDLIDASEWLLSEMDKKRNYPFTAGIAEKFLIDLEVRYVDHVNFHIKSLRKDITTLLKRFSQLENEANSTRDG